MSDLPSRHDPGTPEERARFWEAEHSSLLDSFPDAVFTLDLKGNLIAMNAAGERLSGFSRAEFLQGVFPATIFPLPPLGTGGNLGRNTFRGPSFAQVDTSLSKKIAVTERISVQFRGEAFNTFNHVNLNNPTLDLSSINFGKSTSALIPRQFQLGLKVQF